MVEIMTMINDKLIIRGSLDDAEHITQDQKDRQAALYKQSGDAEFRSRYFGDEFVAGGYVLNFVVDDVCSLEPAWSNNSWCRMIIGLDINHQGQSAAAHPHGIVWMLYSEEMDEFFVGRAARFKGDFANLAHFILTSPFGDAPIAFGADASQGAGNNQTFRDLLVGYNLNMLSKPATLKDGRRSLNDEYGLIQDLLNRGKLKFDKFNCLPLIEELKSLERAENGSILAVREDVASALRYAILDARRFSRAEQNFRSDHGIRKATDGQAAGSTWGEGPGQLSIFSGQVNEGADFDAIIAAARK
jgi:hypothetical protein